MNIAPSPDADIPDFDRTSALQSLDSDRRIVNSASEKYVVVAPRRGQVPVERLDGRLRRSGKVRQAPRAVNETFLRKNDRTENIVVPPSRNGRSFSSRAG